MMTEKRDLLVLSKKILLDPAQLEQEVELLNEILLQTETMASICLSSEIIDINRYTIIYQHRLMEKIINEKKGLRPFQFLSNKN